MSDGSKTDARRRRATHVIPDGDEARARSREVVGSGGVIAFRTDTFYGLGANPFDAAAVSKINELKGREGKPILVVVSDAGEAERLVAERSRLFDLLTRKLWPGALTLVARAREGLPEDLTAGTGTVGVRLPDDEDVRALVRECGGALTATSANRAGEPPSSSADEVARAFPSGLDLIVDGGTARAKAPSTVVDVSGREARLIREGAIAWDEIERAILLTSSI
jgi:L-threonylcarbamoyladenylate synthase